MNTALFQPNLYITDSDAGFLALAASVIMQAVDDVRIYLTAPKFREGKNHKDQIHARSSEAKRATDSLAAAQWLQGPECRELCEILTACGHPVPMKRFFRELKACAENREPKTEN